MTQKIISYETTYNGPQEELRIETRSDLKYMPKGATLVIATFGTFQKTGNGTLLYSTGIAREADGSLVTDPDSDYQSDYRELRNGRVTTIY